MHCGILRGYLLKPFVGSRGGTGTDASACRPENYSVNVSAGEGLINFHDHTILTVGIECGMWFLAFCTVWCGQNNFTLFSLCQLGPLLVRGSGAD